MSRSIDERIVEMQFNNQQFEAGIKESLESIDSLKKGLGNMEDSSKALDEVGDSANKLGLDFTALQVIAVTALAKITDAAIDFGTEMVKSLTIDPLIDGFNAYEKQIESTKAIMNATQKDVDEVGEALERLIFFADETSFSFEQMITSVKLFTGAGVELEDSVTAMQGIGSASALAGVPLAQMNTVYDALSKSIGQGSLRLREWQRLELAGLGTSIEFKQQIIDTALEMGTLVEYNGKYYTSLEAAMKGTESAEVSVSNFGAALKDNWATTEVLMQVFEEYGEFADQVFDIVHDGTNEIELASEAIAYLSEEVQGFSERGYRAAQEARSLTDALDSISQAIAARWRVSWGIIIGDVDEATELWTDFTEALWDVFVVGGDARNEMLGLWKDLGGRDALIQGIANSFEALLSVVEPISAAFRDIFPSTTGERLAEISENFKNFTATLTISEEASDKLQRTFSGLFSALDIVRIAISEVFNGFGKMLSALSPVGQGILSLTAGLGDFVTSIKNFVVESDFFAPAVEMIAGIGERLAEMYESFKTFAEGLTISEETADKFQRTFAGLFAAIDIVRIAASAAFEILGKVVTTLFDGFMKLLSAIFPVGDGILSLTAGLGDFIVALRDSIVESDFFGSAVGIIGTALDTVQDIINWSADRIKEGIDKLKEYFSQFSGIDLGPLKIFSGEVELAFTPFTFLASLFQAAWETIVRVFEWIYPIIAPIAEKIGEALVNFGSAVGEAVRTGDLKALVDLVNTGLLGTVILGLKRFVDGLSELGGAGGILGGLTLLLDGVRGSLEAWQSNLKAQALKNIAIAIGILAAAILVLSTIDVGSMAAALGTITVLFTELSGVMLVLSRFMGSVKLGGVAVQMVLISAAVLILAFAMKKLAGLDWDEVAKGTLAVGILMAELVGATILLSNNTTRMIKGAAGLIAFAAAILILTQAVKQLGALDIATLAKGLVAVGVLMAEVAGFTHIVNPKKLVSTGIAMIAMGAGLKIIASAVVTLSGLSIEELAKGLGSIGIILAEFAGFTHIVDPTKLISTGIAMIAVGAALKIIASAVASFGSMSIEELAKGLISVGLALAALAGFTQIVDTKKILTTSIAMIAMGAALLIVSKSVLSFSTLSWEEIAKGLTTLAGALTIMAAAAHVMKGTAAGSASIMIMALALLTLTPALLLLGSMDLVNIGLALLTLAGVFTIIGVAGAVLGPLVPTILGLSAAILLLGVAVAAIGAGVLAFSVGLTTLSVAATAGGAAIAVLVMTFIELIPAAMIALAEGLLSFVEVIGNGIPIIMEAIRQLVAGLIGVLVELTPDIVVAVFDFIQAMLDVFLDYIPTMVETGLKLIVAFLEGLAKNMKDIVSLALEIISEFLQGILSGVPDIIGAAIDIILAFINTVADRIPDIIDSGFNLILSFVHGLADAIRENTPLLVEAFFDLAGAMIEGLVNGLIAGIQAAIDAVKNLGNSIIDGFKSVLGIASPSKEFYDLGEYTVDGYVDGVEDNSEDAVDAVEEMAKRATNAAYDAFEIQGGRSKIFKELGVMDAQSFIEGLESMGDSIKASLEKVFGADEASLERMTSLIDDALSTIENRVTSYTELASDRMNKLSEESEVSVAEMITNLKHNQIVIAEWADNIAKLAERGLNEGLLEELRDAGPKSAGEVRALVAASDKEIQELNAVMANAGAVATQALVTTVGQAAPLMVEPGKNIVDAIAEGLTSTSSVNDAMQLLIAETKNTAINSLGGTEFKEMGRNITEGLSQGIQENSQDPVDAASLMAEGVAEATAASFGIQSPSTVFAEFGEHLMTGLELGIELNANKPVEALEAMYIAMADVAMESGEKVSAAAEDGLKFNDKTFGEIGAQYGDNFATELGLKDTNAYSSGKNVTEEAERGIRTNENVYGTTGSKYGSDFSTELTNKKSSAFASGRDVSSEAERGIKNNLSEFRSAGVAAGQGFIDGLSSMIEAAAETARELARAASRAANSALDIRSPSRVFRRIGEYTGLGFVYGLADMADDVGNEAENMGLIAINGLKDVIAQIIDIIGEDLESDLTITPVLDLSEIQNGTNLLKDMLSGTSTTANMAMSVSAITAKAKSEVENVDGMGSTETSNNVTNQFIQNNYSPKALSRLEIYRDTKSLFAREKGLVNQ